MTRPAVAVVVPTLNAEADLPRLHQALEAQEGVQLSVQCVDSQSDDATGRLARSYGWGVVQVRRSEFRHGRARNLGARHAPEGVATVFLTQDAVPAHPGSLAALVSPIVQGTALAAYGRHLPTDDASLCERVAREANYPARSRHVCPADVDALGLRAYLFSNTFSAVSTAVFAGLGGFDEACVSNEDMLFARSVLTTGGCVDYVADATVHHSHRHTWRQQLRRSFDSSAAIVRNVPGGRAGMMKLGSGLIRAQLEAAVAARDASAVAEALAHGSARAIGSFLGMAESRLPRAWKARLSNLPNAW